MIILACGCPSDGRQTPVRRVRWGAAGAEGDPQRRRPRLGDNRAPASALNASPFRCAERHGWLAGGSHGPPRRVRCVSGGAQGTSVFLDTRDRDPYGELRKEVTDGVRLPAPTHAYPEVVLQHKKQLLSVSLFAPLAGGARPREIRGERRREGARLGHRTSATGARRFSPGPATSLPAVSVGVVTDCPPCPPGAAGAGGRLRVWRRGHLDRAHPPTRLPTYPPRAPPHASSASHPPLPSQKKAKAPKGPPAAAISYASRFVRLRRADPAPCPSHSPRTRNGHANKRIRTRVECGGAAAGKSSLASRRPSSARASRRRLPRTQSGPPSRTGWRALRPPRPHGARRLPLPFCSSSAVCISPDNTAATTIPPGHRGCPAAPRGGSSGCPPDTSRPSSASSSGQSRLCSAEGRGIKTRPGAR